MNIKIVIADDHPIVTEGFSALLGARKHIEVWDTYSTGQALLRGLKKRLPDVLLLDMRFPDATGNELARTILEQYRGLRILVLTSVDNLFDIKEMMQMGCAGYLMKNTGIDILVNAIEIVHSGGTFLLPSLKEQLFDVLLSPENGPYAEPRLTQREVTIMELLVEGNTNSEIAEKLFLSLRTIENNRMSLYHKLGVKNTAGLIKTALQKGYIK